MKNTLSLKFEANFEIENIHAHSIRVPNHPTNRESRVITNTNLKICK